jgi:DNA-binding NtrC family response regulator
MENPIKILIVEDALTDAELAMREIRKTLDDAIFERVETESEYLEALATFQPDVVLSDYNLPTFDGMRAIHILKANSPFTPLIIWTGSNNEETAVQCMKAGAVNYVIKDNIKRLGTAVIRALEERKIKLERKKADEDLIESKIALEKSNAFNLSVFDSISEHIAVLDGDGTIIAVNAAWKQYAIENGASESSA